MSADTSSDDDRPRVSPSRTRRHGGKGTGPRLGTQRPVPAPTSDKPSLREVRAALAVALAEADRPEELEEAVEAYRRGGVEGIFGDQGHTVASRVLALVGQARRSGGVDPEPDPVLAEE